MPRRPTVRLTDEQLWEITNAPERETSADLARRIGAEYFTVHAARRRIVGQSYPLERRACSVCGAELLTGNGRTYHAGCEAGYRRLDSAKRRAAGQEPTSTRYVAAWRERHPKADRSLREREKAARRERWPDLPAEERDAALAKLHAATERDQAETAAVATSGGAEWEQDDEYLLARWTRPAREVALALGRTAGAVRSRKSTLRRTRPDDARLAAADRYPPR